MSCTSNSRLTSAGTDVLSSIGCRCVGRTERTLASGPCCAKMCKTSQGFTEKIWVPGHAQAAQTSCTKVTGSDPKFSATIRPGTKSMETFQGLVRKMIFTKLLTGRSLLQASKNFHVNSSLLGLSKKSSSDALHDLNAHPEAFLFVGHSNSVD